MSEEESIGIVDSNDSKAGFLKMLFVIPKGLDFANSCLIILFLLSLIIELCYICSPQFVKRILEKLDFNKDSKNKISYTGCASLLTLLLLITTWF